MNTKKYSQSNNCFLQEYSDLTGRACIIKNLLQIFPQLPLLQNPQLLQFVLQQTLPLAFCSNLLPDFISNVFLLLLPQELNNNNK